MPNEATAKALKKAGWEKVEKGVYVSSTKSLLNDNKSSSQGRNWDAEYEDWKAKRLQERKETADKKK